MAFDNDQLRAIGKNILDFPQNYMISPEGKLFTKCGSCTAWHGIESMNVIE